MTLSESESREIRVGVAVAVLGAFVVSLMGGALGVYVGYRLLEQRMTSAEATISDLSHDMAVIRRDYDDKLSRLLSDVSYIRGKMENK